MVTFFVESVICVILGYGGYLALQGKFPMYQLVEYTAISETTSGPSWRSQCSSKDLPRQSLLNRITELLDDPLMGGLRRCAGPRKTPRGGIEFAI